ncbi:MAG: archaellin/type IV pilin N-terminal domain-containing protein [Candidatus Nanohaloarchaea archaeon]
MYGTRHGISPILATIVMTMIAIAMAAGAATVLTQSQDAAISAAEQGRLETVNTTCLPDRVTWWINNTGDTSLTGSPSSLFVEDADGVNTTLSQDGLTVTAGFTEAGGIGRFSTTPDKPLELGTQYTLQLTVDDAAASTTCTVGERWWNADWRYRRAIDIDAPSSDVTARLRLDDAVDVEEMVADGKLRGDCADLRIVNHGAVASYDIRECNPGTAVRVRANLSQPERGTAYLYYGNLQAGYGNVSVDETVTHENPELGPEERVRLP